MVDDARPTNPQPITEADVYTAVKEFILAYSKPDIPADNIRQGWINRASLPAKTEEYAVMQILYDVQDGTTVEQYDPVTGELSVSALVELNVQVDFYSKGDIARARAQRIAVLTRSTIGVQFFNDRGMSARYADNVINLSDVEDAAQFVRRYSVTLHLAYNSGETVDVEAADDLKVERLENVDVHHPERI